MVASTCTVPASPSSTDTVGDTASALPSSWAYVFDPLMIAASVSSEK